MKISAYWLIAALIIGIAATYVYFKFFYTPDQTFSVNPRIDHDVVTLKLPKDSNTKVFGPKYWEVYHKLTEMIPCPGCRIKAVPFISFFHDVVNSEIGKPIFDKDNFNMHIDLISKLPKA